MATATFYPKRNEARGLVDVALVILEHGGVGGRNCRFAGFLHDAQRFAGEVHVIAEIANLIVRHVLEILELRHFRSDIVDQRTHGQHSVGLEFLGTNEIRDVIARMRQSRRFARHICWRGFGGLTGDRYKILGLSWGDGVVQRVGRGHGTDEDEHDQAHAFLAVVRTVKEADSGAGEHQ